MNYDPWAERTRQLRLAREQIARDSQPPQEEHPLLLALVLAGFAVIFVAFLFLEKT